MAIQNSSGDQTPEISGRSSNIMPSDSPYIPPQINKGVDTKSNEDLTVGKSTPPIPTQAYANIAPVNVTIESKKGKSLFKYFVIVGILIIIIIYALVAYLYFKNKNLKQSPVISTPNVLQVPIQTPTFNAANVIIMDGNIVYKKDNGQTETLINKLEFPATGITGFSRVIVSPDSNKLCFESLPPSTKPGLYLSDVDGSNTSLIGTTRNKCLWNSTSDAVFYQGKTIGTGNSSIYMYNLKENTEYNLTASSQIVPPPDFMIVGLSSDESQLICSYPNFEGGVNQCTIDLLTKTVTTL